MKEKGKEKLNDKPKDNLKDRFIELIDLFRNNKKKAIVIGIAAVIVLIFIIVIICMLCNYKNSVILSSTASTGELTKESDIDDETSDDETISEIKEITTEEQTSDISEEDSEDSNSKSQLENEYIDTTVNQSDTNTVNNTSGINNNVGADTGALRVSGTHLVDKNGNVVQLKGISTHGLAWFPEYINEACFKQLHEEFGVNVIRLAMYTAEYNGYCTGGDKNYLKSLVDNGVKCATDNNMYVIIDWHILSDGNPNTYIGEAKEFFEEMSSKYASYSNVIYEICNEPNGGTSWSDIKNYATQVIDVIRRNDKDGIIIVGTPNWSQYVNEASANPITGYDNIMYSLHFYAATHTDDLRNTMVQAINNGLPIFISEFGICDASGNGAIDEEQAGKWINLLNQYGISYVMWNLSNKSETSAIINSSCSKTSGYSVDDLSDSGKWFLKLMTGGLNISKNDDSQIKNNVTVNAEDSQIENKVTVNAEAKLINSWESEGKKFYQYEVSVTNNSGAACSSWSADIKFAGNIQISDSWNGNYTVNGSVLHIESVDYNGTLNNGESVGNIGFIISGDV
jgi:endoglucanase